MLWTAKHADLQYREMVLLDARGKNPQEPSGLAWFTQYRKSKNQRLLGASARGKENRVSCYQKVTSIPLSSILFMSTWFCECVHIHVLVCTHAGTCADVYTCLYTCRCVHVHVHVLVCTDPCTRTDVYTCMYMCWYAHGVYMCRCAHMHMKADGQPWVSFLGSYPPWFLKHMSLTDPELFPEQYKNFNDLAVSPVLFPTPKGFII